jgi:hypothetical protein
MYLRLPIALVVLAVATATLPTASSLHNGSSIGSDSQCVVTVCAHMTIIINADDCAWLPLGTPCTVYVRGWLGGSSTLGGHASGTIGPSSASCGWGAGGSCSANIQQFSKPSFRGEMVCISGTMYAQDTLFVTPLTFTHCYEAH